jgi:predicted nucleotidyltransferase component of viral defense system
VIPKQEILELARKHNIAPNIIEKDYVLGWILAGINQHPDLNQKWIFKGGTALKKCFFNDYRFSEDLDFTILDRTHINQNFLNKTFLEILDWTYEHTGIEFAQQQTKFDIHPEPTKQYVTGSIYYTGPLRQGGSLNKIYLDILANELLVLESNKLSIHHIYSDRPDDGLFAHCYKLEEIFAEKIRALTERARPRDLYDVISIFKHKIHLINKELLLDTLKQKCEFKKISLPTLDSILNHIKFNELNEEWDNMLKHQVSNLEEINTYFKELAVFFVWLNNVS